MADKVSNVLEFFEFMMKVHDHHPIVVCSRSDRMVLEAALSQSGLLGAESPPPPPPTSVPNPHTGYSTSPTKRKVDLY